MHTFTNIPFFRICIPFVAGILVAVHFSLPHISWLYLVLPFTLALLAHLYAKKRSFPQLKWLFIIASDIFLFVFALLLTEMKNARLQPGFYANQVPADTLVSFVGVVSDLPVEKEKFLKCELKVLQIKQGKTFIPGSGTVLAYLKKSQAARDVCAGQTLLIKAQLLEPEVPKNPYEFNYRDYLHKKQIYHTAFIDSARFTILKTESPLHPVWALGLHCKRFLLERLKNSGLSANAYGICAALLTGYDDDIDRTVMEAFSHTGTLHVLSVSGLHTGLIYMALHFLFSLFDPGKKYKLTRFLFITFFLWFFALITGFSAPVLRAVIMFNLLGFGKIYFRANHQHQLNILLVSAFFLLVYNPYYISDVGFLLSYFALFGLIYFQPRFSAVWEPKNKFVENIWHSVTASVAATVSTLPITLFYFKQFPLWFFVCNIVVVPATFLLLILAVFTVMKLSFFVILTNYLVQGLIWFIHLFNSEKFGYVDRIHFNHTDMFFMALWMLFLSTAITGRRYVLLIWSFLVLIGWQVSALLESYQLKNKSLLVVYHTKKESVNAVKNRQNLFVSPVSQNVYNYHVKSHVSNLNYPEQKTVPYNAVKSTREFVLFLSEPGFWPQTDYHEVTTLVIANNFRLRGSDIARFPELKTVIVNGTNNSYTASAAEELCRNFGLVFYSTKYKGAFLLALP